MPVALTPATALTVTTTTGLDYSSGNQSGLGVVIYVITSGITGTWTFLFNHVTASGTVIPLTTVTAGVTTNVATNCVLAAPFALTAATPLPNQVVATESVAGSVTMRVLVSWA